MPFWQWQFFRKGWDGSALLVQPSKSNRSNWQILFVLGSYEYLERLEGRIRDGVFFLLKNQIITVWSALLCGKFLWATLILFVCPVWPWALNLMNLGMSCLNEMPFLYPSRENIAVKLKRLCIIALKKSQVKCKKKRLFLYSFYFIHIRRICDFICSSTFKKHQAGLLMYLQKNIDMFKIL